MALDDRSRVSRLIDAGLDREAAVEGARTAPTLGGPMDPIAQLELLGPHLAGVVAGISDEQLDNPTPCTDYTVRGVLEHMIGGATAFAAAYRGEQPSEPDLSDPLGDFPAVLGDLVGAITAPGALERTVAAPFGAVPGETFARFVVLDGLVHGWDMATATGQAYQPPDELVAAADAFAHEALDPLRDGTTFAEATDPSPGAPPIVRLAAYTGRQT
ncbi:MAG: TIGR03086 family metal-binding protein [Acidimicrobiales bacterium]